MHNVSFRKRERGMESIVKTAGNSGSIVVNIYGEVPKDLSVRSPRVYPQIHS